MDGYTATADGIDYRSAIIATGLWIGVGLALDAYLVAKGKTYLITDVLRTKPGKVGLTVLGLHVVNCLGKADPFRAAAGLINWKVAAATAATAAAAVEAVEAVTPALTDAQTGKK